MHISQKKKKSFEIWWLSSPQTIQFFPGHHVRIDTNWQFTVKTLRLLCPYFGHFSCIAVVYMTHWAGGNGTAGTAMAVRVFEGEKCPRLDSNLACIMECPL